MPTQDFMLFDCAVPPSTSPRAIFGSISPASSRLELFTTYHCSAYSAHSRKPVDTHCFDASSITWMAWARPSAVPPCATGVRLARPPRAPSCLRKSPG